jgi:C4-type Zn-finger protein
MRRRVVTDNLRNECPKCQGAAELVTVPGAHYVTGRTLGVVAVCRECGYTWEVEEEPAEGSVTG